MSRVFVTGDTHGMIDAKHISLESFAEGKNLSRDDYLIVAGDFGLLFHKDEDKAKPFREFIEGLPFTVLWLDGNHENFDQLAQYPISYWHGGNIQKILDNCYHLLRGQVYDLAGKSIFTFGGGCSIDKFMRKEGVSWWKQEIPDKQEMDEGIFNLANHGNKVDYIITHAAPKRVMQKLYGGNGYEYGMAKDEMPLGRYFDYLVENIDFKKWYHGHLHIDDLDSFHEEKICLIYKNVVELE